jgi:hypothetical protein
MSFGRFLWLLQNKKLWLARSDYLGDPWELSISDEQFLRILNRHPIEPVDKHIEKVMDRTKRVVREWRQRTYVNCWTANDHESHALWRIFCPTSEGVAIQTTLGKLEASIGDLRVHEVEYGKRYMSHLPQLETVAITKRPMFAYEHEVRILRIADREASEYPPGFELAWDPEQHVEAVRVHPEADVAFMSVVIQTINAYSPALSHKLDWSAMSVPPPV